MAINSKREQILVLITNKLTELSVVTTVSRVRPVFAELDTIASTQLPMVAVVGGLPFPIQKISGRKQNNPEYFKSRLKVDIYFYALANVDPDTWVSNYADEVWKKLFECPTFGKEWILNTNVEPEVQVGIFDPYIVFKMVCTVTYIHDTGGI